MKNLWVGAGGSTILGWADELLLSKKGIGQSWKTTWRGGKNSDLGVWSPGFYSKDCYYLLWRPDTSLAPLWAVIFPIYQTGH